MHDRSPAVLRATSVSVACRLRSSSVIRSSKASFFRQRSTTVVSPVTFFPALQTWTMCCSRFSSQFSLCLSYVLLKVNNDKSTSSNLAVSTLIDSESDRPSFILGSPQPPTQSRTTAAKSIDSWVDEQNERLFGTASPVDTCSDKPILPSTAAVPVARPSRLPQEALPPFRRFKFTASGLPLTSSPVCFEAKIMRMTCFSGPDQAQSKLIRFRHDAEHCGEHSQVSAREMF